MQGSGFTIQLLPDVLYMGENGKLKPWAPDFPEPKIVNGTGTETSFLWLHVVLRGAGFATEPTGWVTEA